MGDSRAHVQASGGRPQCRRSAVVRDRRGSGVRHQPPAPAPPPPPLPGGRPRRSRATVLPAAGRVPTRSGTTSVPGSPPCAPSSRDPASTPVRHDRLARRAGGPGGALDLHDPPDPARRGARRARAAQAPAQLLDPLRGGSAQRGLAVGLHPLAPGRRERGRDRELARRPLPLPARVHGLPPGRWRRRVRRSPPPATPTAGQPPRSPTTGPSTPPGWSAAATASSTCRAYLGVRQKNGAPGHPQTQGKIERFHQTLKRWLARQPAARDLAALQAPGLSLASVKGPASRDIRLGSVARGPLRGDGERDNGLATIP